jgi:hypothetical protein
MGGQGSTLGCRAIDDDDDDDESSGSIKGGEFLD